MSITEKELEHLAVLSKLKLSPEEKKKFLNNMDSIINFLDQLKTTHVNTTFLSYWLTTLTIVKNRKMMINSKIRHILL